MDVLRLAGPPGVGKSSVAWAVAEVLVDGGQRIAFVDIDQLGMCYPAPSDDPERWALKERTLAAVAAVYRAAGVERLVVSGVATPDGPPPRLGSLVVRSVWLDAAPDVRRVRLGPRGWSAARVDDVVAVGTDESARLDGRWSRLVTDGMSVTQTVTSVLAAMRTDTVHAPDSGRTDGVPRSRSRGPVLWLTGPRCAGASTVGWVLASEAWRDGRTTAFADLDQLTFTWNLGWPRHRERRVALDAVASMREVFAGAGAEELIVVAGLDVDPSAVRETFPGATVSFVRLDAADDVLRDRAIERTRGDGPVLAGDDLVGASVAEAESIADAAVIGRPSAARPGETVIDTTALGTGAVAAALRSAVHDGTDASC